jgi:acetyl-CoA carboxylase biotin carboxyl carrier protein
MTTEEIKELIRMVEESGIAELEVQRGDSRVRIRRQSKSRTDVVLPTVVPVSMGSAVSAHPVVTAEPVPPPAAPEPPAKVEPKTTSIKSPIVGTYYDSPAPGAPPFVKVGDTVSVKQVLCIIESMKLMNEIESDVAGTIVSKAVEDGRPVEYGELLFKIQPA